MEIKFILYDKRLVYNVDTLDWYFEQVSSAGWIVADYDSRVELNDFPQWADTI